MKTEVYDIEGMSCAACSSAVERVTRKLEGVEYGEGGEGRIRRLPSGGGERCKGPGGGKLGEAGAAARHDEETADRGHLFCGSASVHFHGAYAPV